MIDNMNEITLFSPYGGKLVKEAGMMISEFPDDYQMSKELLIAPVVAYLCNNLQAEEYLKAANGVTEADRRQLGEVNVYTNPENNCIRHGSRTLITGKHIIIFRCPPIR